MTTAVANPSVIAKPADISGVKAIERAFPIEEISRVAEQESWRKEVNRPIYHIHKWWATRLGSVFRAITLGALKSDTVEIWPEFYKTHNLHTKVVLDPFMGSGTTIGEALKLGCKAIGCDINPVSTFLVRQALTRVDIPELRQAFAALESVIAPEIRKYYRTLDPLTGEHIPVLYYFWVKTVKTPDGEAVPLFSSYVFSKDAYPKKKPRAQIVCPECWGVIEDRFDALALLCKSCGHAFNPQEGPANGQQVRTRKGQVFKIKDLVAESNLPPEHRMYAMLALRPNGEKVYLPVTEADRALYQEAERRLESEDLPLPTLAVRAGHNTNQAIGYNYRHWREFFNARQLLCLGLLLREIMQMKDKAIQEQLLCLFSSTLEFNNLFCSFKGEGTGAVRHMFSNHILKPERTPLENNVWGTDKSSGAFSTLFESRLLRAKKYLDDPFEVAVMPDLLDGFVSAGKMTASSKIDIPLVGSWDELAHGVKGALILNGDSSNLSIPDESVDAVITDPPYFDFVHYSELSDFFFAWLAPVLKNRYPYFERENSFHKGEVQNKDPQFFAHQLKRVFSESARVLKRDGILAFSFHHSRVEGWAAISQAIQESGFRVVAAHPLHAELRSSSPKSAAKDPISLDAILVCKKKLGYEDIMPSPSVEAIQGQTEHLLEKLEKSGMSLSSSDRFVVSASQALIALTDTQTDFEGACHLLEGLVNHQVEAKV